MRPGAAVLILSLFATTTFAGWSTSSPSVPGPIAAVVVAPSDANVIWAGGAGGVFRSSDAGATWADVSGPVVDVDYLAVDPRNANNAWALTGTAPSSRLYRTRDGGATWIDSTDGLPALHPSGLVLDPRDPDALWLSSACENLTFSHGPGAGLFKSTGGGATWTPALGGGGADQPCIDELTIDPFSPWRLFVTGAFSEDTQMESYDGGRTWERAGGPRPGRAIVFDARFPFTHYGITGPRGSRFVVSQDGGFTWSVVPTNLLDVNLQPTALSMDPARSRIFMGTGSGLYRSGNGGSIWANTTLHEVEVHALDWDSATSTLFVATHRGLFAIPDRGLGEPRSIDFGERAASVVALAVDPAQPNLVYAGTTAVAGPGPYRGRVYRSADAGASWQRLAGDDDTLKAAVITVDAAGTVYAFAGFGIGFYRRGRNDAAWTLTPVSVNYGVDVAADPKHAGVVFLAEEDAGVRRSTDAGNTWTHVLDFPGVLAIDPSDPRRVYVAGMSKLARSDDGGTTWTTIPNSPTYGAIVVAPSDGNILYRFGIDAGVFRLERSADRGATWRPTAQPPGGLPQQSVGGPHALAVDPRDANSVWTSNGVDLVHSPDGGATWQKVPPPFTVSYGPTKLVFDPSGRVLHVAFPNHGVWELTTE